MVFVNAVAGCEAYNMRFFTHKGVAISASSPRELARLTAAILSDQELLSQMAENYRGAEDNTAAKAIAQEVIRRGGR